VFYLSPQFVNQSGPGYVAERISASNGDPEAAPVVQIRLHVQGSPLIYEGALTKAQTDQIRDGISQMLIDFGVGRSVSMVQHPGWYPFACDIPNGMLVYDCMDNHHGFVDSGKALENLEERLLRDADLTVVTSDWLQEYAAPRARKTAMVRNACEYQHFADAVRIESIPGLEGRGPDKAVIGYYGAIAEWFDVELVERVAQQYPEALILLIGADSSGVGKQLSRYPNIKMLGEVPYRELPAYVARMDVCMIPFVINDLIRATNPVKIYEMLAAGKPVVTTDLPELRERHIDELIHRAATHDEFVRQVGLAMRESDDKELVQRRLRYAASQDWATRSITLDNELAALRAESSDDSLVSIVVVTWNNLDLTKACVESVLADTSYSSIELVIVDNASSDETPAFLRDLDAREERVRVILNDENTGFSRGNNIGLHASRGNYVVLLNNDTVVTHGWIRTMVNHLNRDQSIGILGVITNNIGNEARVETRYKSVEDMPSEAFLLTRRGLGDVFDIPVVAFFCCGMRRGVYEQIGDLDENYGLGFFEDDDYCQRVREVGLRVCCANDIFVHHHLSASFNKIGSSKKDQLFKKNKEYYESKWGTWVPHCERGDPGAVKATAR
jgi:GT2 family glycosyltransferase/glycosyltransferase involved in cell wall biosynthesis